MPNRDAESDQGQPLIEHIIELRSRLIKALLSVFIIFLALFYFANNIYDFIALPLQRLLPEGGKMAAIDVTATLVTPLKLTLYVSVYIAVPYILYQIWAFVAPALYLREKKIALPLLISSIVLFYIGTAFAYFLVFPMVFKFLTSVGPKSVVLWPDMSNYLDFVIKLFFAFGAAFEIPIATILLIYSGVISPRSMASKRPYVIVICFVLGMLMTPPDVMSQLLLALPMWLLFEAGLFFGRFLKARVDDPQTAEET